MEKLRDQLSLDSDRRRRVFELKTTQYENYVILLDKVGRDQHDDMTQKFAPVLEEYFSKALDDDISPEEGKRNTQWFHNEIMKMSQEGISDLMHIKNESSRLKLTATEEMLGTFEKINNLVQESMDLFQDFMNGFVDMFLSSNTVLIEQKTKALSNVGLQINEAREEMITQMRKELNQI